MYWLTVFRLVLQVLFKNEYITLKDKEKTKQQNFQMRIKPHSFLERANKKRSSSHFMYFKILVLFVIAFTFPCTPVYGEI